MAKCSLSLGLLAGLFLASSRTPGADTPSPPAWAHWRGPSMQGYSDDSRAPLSWSEQENILWKTKLPGTGNSTPIIWGGRVFLTTASKDGKELQVLCLKAKDGTVLWQHLAARDNSPSRTHAWNGYASPSCTTDGTYVYAFFGTPGLFCYDMEGTLVWKHAFGIFTNAAGWGTAASPFLFEDLVIQNCDNDGPKALPPRSESGSDAPMALVALNKKTGAVVWTAPRNMGRGFSTPCLIPMGHGRVDLVLNGPRSVRGYDPRTGKERWRCERFDAKDQERFGEPLPVFNSEALFVLSGRPGPCQAIRLPANGDVTRTNVLWQKTRNKHRDVASPILVDGRIFVADSKGTLSGYDFKTGDQMFDNRIDTSVGKSLASPVLVRGKILWLLDNGVTVVQEPGPTFKVAARNKLGDGSAVDFGASPAIAGGRLFLRSQSHLYCIGEAK